MNVCVISVGICGRQAPKSSIPPAPVVQTHTHTPPHLVDPRLVREGVGPDNRLVGLDDHARQRGDQPRSLVDLRRLDVGQRRLRLGRAAEAGVVEALGCFVRGKWLGGITDKGCLVAARPPRRGNPHVIGKTSHLQAASSSNGPTNLANVQRHHNLLQRRVPRALSDAVDRALHLWIFVFSGAYVVTGLIMHVRPPPYSSLGRKIPPVPDATSPQIHNRQQSNGLMSASLPGAPRPRWPP